MTAIGCCAAAATLVGRPSSGPGTRDGPTLGVGDGEVSGDAGGVAEAVAALGLAIGEVGTVGDPAATSDGPGLSFRDVTAAGLHWTATSRTTAAATRPAASPTARRGRLTESRPSTRRNGDTPSRRGRWKSCPLRWLAGGSCDADRRAAGGYTGPSGRSIGVA